MSKSELLNRINSLNASHIGTMSLEVMPTLTDNFDESLVRALLLRGHSNIEQREILAILKRAYDVWMKKRNPYWGTRRCSAEYPRFMMEMQLDIECGSVLTSTEMIGSWEGTTNDVIDTSSGSGEINIALKARVDELEAELEGVVGCLREESESIQAVDKIRLELLLQLMEKDGADLDNYGNKANAAKVIQFVTDLPSSTCKNYCTNRDLNTKYHAESISKVNHVLKELEMKTQL